MAPNIRRGNAAPFTDMKMGEREIIERFDLPDEHCVSCHEDEGYGYQMCYIEIDGEYVEVCCRVARNFERVGLGKRR